MADNEAYKFALAGWSHSRITRMDPELVLMNRSDRKKEKKREKQEKQERDREFRERRRRGSNDQFDDNSNEHNGNQQDEESNGPVAFSIQGKFKEFVLYEGDGTLGGKSIFTGRRPKAFSSKSVFIEEITGHETDLKRMSTYSLLSGKLGFQYEQTNYTWDVNWKQTYYELINERTKQTVAGFYRKFLAVRTQGELLIYGGASMNPRLRHLIIATCYEILLRQDEQIAVAASS